MTIYVSWKINMLLKIEAYEDVIDFFVFSI